MPYQQGRRCIVLTLLTEEFLVSERYSSGQVEVHSQAYERLKIIIQGMLLIYCQRNGDNKEYNNTVG